MNSKDIAAGKKIVIIADDLTGALDAAGPLAMSGLSCCVVTDDAALEAALVSQADVVSVSTNSREISPAAAGQRVRAVTDRLDDKAVVIKKIDSRLKGNIAAELAAFGRTQIMLLPAIPEFGRIVADGMVTGFGLEAAVCAGDRLGSSARHCLVPDCASRDEMRTLVKDAREDMLLAGARGMFDVLAELYFGAATTRAARPLICPAPALVVIGSVDPITRAQTAFAQQKGISYHRVRAGQMQGGVPDDKHAILCLEGLSVSAGDLTALADCAAGLLNKRKGLVMSGGATAQAVLNKLNITSLHLCGEILPGVPLSVANGLTLITKSGGFGDEGVLVRLLGGTGGQL